MSIQSFDRRDFLRQAAIACASISVLQSQAMTPSQTRAMAAHPDFLDHYLATIFSLEQKATVAAIARHIIPTTDTPGADEANVALFIELMVEYWLTENERKIFLGEFNEFDSTPGLKFSQRSHTQQRQLLENLESKVSDAAWFKLGNTLRTWDAEAPFICQVKELTVLGFMLSEVGSREFLQLNKMGEFRGDIAKNNDTYAYATDMPLRVFVKDQ